MSDTCPPAPHQTGAKHDHHSRPTDHRLPQLSDKPAGHEYDSVNATTSGYRRIHRRDIGAAGDVLIDISVEEKFRQTDAKLLLLDLPIIGVLWSRRRGRLPDPTR